MAACNTINAGAVNLRSSAPASPSGFKSTVLMLAVQDGPAGERNLREWVTFAEHAIFLPPVWVICSENSAHKALVKDLEPHVQPFVVAEGTSWATVLSIFRDQVCCESASVRSCFLPCSQRLEYIQKSTMYRCTSQIYVHSLPAVASHKVVRDVPVPGAKIKRNSRSRVCSTHRAGISPRQRNRMKQLGLCIGS